jgi:hypothetical protein
MSVHQMDIDPVAYRLRANIRREKLVGNLFKEDSEAARRSARKIKEHEELLQQHLRGEGV